MKQVVVGVGNPIMTDDGLAKRAIESIEDAEVNAETYFASTTAFLALEAMQGADRAIVIDALDVPGAEPGSIHRYLLNGADPDPSTPEVLMHDFSFSDAIEMGECAYSIPEEMVLIGMVPERVEAGLSLTDTVRERIPVLVDRIVEELNRPHMEATQ
jgi:hydrogenase maturation protease